MENICPHFGVCGGCSRQDVPYSDQLVLKEAKVRELLADVVSEAEFLPILPSPETFYYRNKMEFSFGDSRDAAILSVPPARKGETKKESKRLRQEKKEKEKALSDIPLEERVVHVGLHPKGRFNLVTSAHDCRLLSEESKPIMKAVADWATENNIPIFTRHNGEGWLRHLVVREGKNTGERMVNLFTKSDLKNIDSLEARLRPLKVTTFIWTRHDGLSDVAEGQSSDVIWGEGLITEKVGQASIRVPPSSFMQTNTKASEKMIEVLEKWIQADVGERLLPVLFDLYCGAGTIGLNVARFAHKLVGIEINEAAVIEARENARLNGVENAEFTAGRVEDRPDIFSSHPDVKKSALVVDPPRAGLHSKVIEAILSSETPLIYYVSCNPESLARDLRGLGGKYRIEAVQPMDFFPHTDHVETAVKLRLK